MKKLILYTYLIFFLLLPVPGQKKTGPQDYIRDLKKYFDLPAPGETGWNSYLPSDNYPGEAGKLKSEMATNLPLFMESGPWEYTLMKGGYFTMGTSMGSYEGIIDDHCQVTFGHPYALSSFIYPVIDGIEYKPEKVPGSPTDVLGVSGDTLLYQQILGGIIVRTRIFTTANNDLAFSYQLENADSTRHNIGLGLLFDVALGRWGDGYVVSDDEAVYDAQPLSLINNEIRLSERDSVPQGIGIAINFNGFLSPDKVQIGNWSDEYSGRDSEGRIYDLALNASWESLMLVPDSSLEFGFTIVSLLPDDPGKSFLRWDLPQAFTLEDNMLFPKQIETHVEIVNEYADYQNMSLRIPETDFTFAWESSDAIVSDKDQGMTYQEARIAIPEIYDTTLIPVSLQLWEGNEMIDELERWVFIPATVFSNEGLDVQIDTAFANYGRINLSFRAKKELTGQLLYKLHRSNIFLSASENLIEDFSMIKDTTGGLNKTDIVFVLDVTGSMGNEIEAVRDNIIEFADSLSYRGIDYRLGMVTFLDVIENVYAFTEDVQEFQLKVSEQYAHGGGDGPENSLDALSTASQLSFRDDAVRIFIWITDNSYHISDNVTQETKESVIDQLLAKGVQVFCVGADWARTDYYDQIIMNTGGSYYDINGNFRDVLFDVTRLQQSTNYLVSFVADEQFGTGDEVRIEVHYGGLGGADSILFSSITPAPGLQKAELEIMPNPVSSETRLIVTTNEACNLSISIYDVLGRSLAVHTVKSFSGKLGMNFSDIIDIEKLESNRIYLLQVRMLSSPGAVNTYKIIKSANHQ